MAKKENKSMNLGEKNNPITEVKKVQFSLRNGEIVTLRIPKSVYPPREDSILMMEILEKLKPNGIAMEIGCGSGLLSIALAKNNWEIESCDVNPFAVSAAKENSHSASLADKINFTECGFGENEFNIPKNTKLLFWNLPYLNPPSIGEPRLDWIEEASMSDLEGDGWGHKLADYLEEKISTLEPDLLVILLQRKYPLSPSKTEYWTKSGWSHRILKEAWIHDEKLEIVAYWKPGQGVLPTFIDECDTTMDEAKKLPSKGWQRILTNNQIKGRGRRSSIWKSNNKDIAGTWNIRKSILKKMEPGILQIIVGVRIANVLGQFCKWPNDILDSTGKKLGGILVEMDNKDDFLRIGVGINNSAKKIDQVKTTGWDKNNSEITKHELIKMIDSSLSSLFEEHELLKNYHQPHQIEIESWRGLSKLLSRGYSLESDKKKIRITGMSNSGKLIKFYHNSNQEVEDFEKLKWLF
mgnify:FL=1